MIVVVQPGETLWGISRRTGVSVEVLADVNQIPDPNVLVEGQALWVPQPEEPADPVGEVIGFAYPFLSAYVLDQTLPTLSGLAVFSYGFTPEGCLLPPALNDRWMAERAKKNGVMAVLVLTPLNRSGMFSNVLISDLLSGEAARRRLLEQLRQKIGEFGFGEVNIDFEYILPEDRDRFSAFVEQAAQTLPVPVSVCLAPKVRRDQRGLLFEGKDFRALGQAADRVMLMTYEWGYKYGPPMAVAPMDQVRRVADYALSEIPAEKIRLGLANYGYDWPLPFVQGETVARTIGSVEAVDIARRNRAGIRYDASSQSPWFSYRKDGTEHVVWFEDVRSWQQKLDLIREYGLAGAGIWTVMNLNKAGLSLLGEAVRSE